MNDLISRYALCEYAMTQTNKSVTPNDIMRFPSAQSEIIKCKDCKYYTSVTAHCEIRGKGLFLIRGLEDFCSRAERRTE